MPTCATAGVSAVGFFQSLPPIFIFLASAASLVSTSPGAVAWHEDRNMTLRYSRKKRHTLIKLHPPLETWSFAFIRSWPKRDKKSSHRGAEASSTLDKGGRHPVTGPPTCRSSLCASCS